MDESTSLVAAYERAFRTLVWRLQPRRLQAGVERMLARAERRAGRGMEQENALEEVYAAARGRAIQCLLRRRRVLAVPTPSRLRREAQFTELLDLAIPAQPPTAGPDFHCDAGLGGLARWLRAAGYEAAWWPEIDDDTLLEKTLGGTAILLTSDRRLMARGVIAHGALAALLVPISRTKHGQFAFVRARLELPLRPARCMACGGELVPVDKQAMRERIPPRTYPWLDEYFLCSRCDRLYWEGTHWERISRGLESVPPGQAVDDEIQS